MDAGYLSNVAIAKKPKTKSVPPPNKTPSTFLFLNALIVLKMARIATKRKMIAVPI